MTTDWEPLLSSSFLAPAINIAQQLPPLLKTPSIAEGNAGAALFLAYLGGQQDGFEEQAQSTLEAAIESVSLDAEMGLFFGLCGIGFVVEHTNPDGSDGVCLPLDEVLFERLREPQGCGPAELLFGLVGVAVYLLERPKTDLTLSALCSIVAHLERLSEEDKNGIYWPEQIEHLVQKSVNLGLAHGQPGIISLLVRLHKTGVAPEKTKRLLEGAVSWMLAHQIEHPACFPDVFVPVIPPTPARSGWCYGAPGIALSLLGASEALGLPKLREKAIEIARRCAPYSFTDPEVRDAGLCHGSAGLAHLFNRLYQTTHEPAFKETSLLWYQRLLSQRSTEGIGGYLFATMPEANRVQWIESPALLFGSMGVGLSLLAGISNEEPAWDRLLLLSFA